MVVLFAAGCGGGNVGGGGSSVPPATPLTTVSGVVVASDSFTSGTVNAYAFTGGVKAGFLASAAIDSTGAYHLTVPASSGAILIEAASGCYNEKAIPWITATYQYPSVLNAVTASVCSASPVLSAAVLVPAGATALVAAVTPYTHAAVGLAEYEIRNGSTTTIALNDANTRLSQWVGADIQTTLPTAPARSSTVGSATLYGSLLSGIPSWLLNVATTSPAVFGAGDLTSLAFADAMKSDLAQDGVLNGVGRDANGNAVALQIGGVALTTTIYRHETRVLCRDSSACEKLRAHLIQLRKSRHASLVSCLPLWRTTMQPTRCWMRLRLLLWMRAAPSSLSGIRHPDSR